MEFTGEKKNDPLSMYAGDIMTVSSFSFLLPTFLLVIFFPIFPSSQMDDVTCSVYFLFSSIDDYFHYWQVNVNLAGLPALVLPCGFVNSSSVALPVGVQMISAAFEEVSFSAPTFSSWYSSVKNDI